MDIESYNSTASRNDRIATSVVRILFAIALVATLVSVSLRGQWEARIRIKGAGTFITHLPNAPIWRAPATPDYEEFAKIFDALPVQQPVGSVISRVFRWDRVAIDLFLWCWLVTTFIGGLYMMTRGIYVDTLLHFVLYIAIGLTFGACACVGLWLIFGGWGAPAPLFFAICGLILGVIVGVRRLPVVVPPKPAPTNATEIE